MNGTIVEVRRAIQEFKARVTDLSCRAAIDVLEGAFNSQRLSDLDMRLGDAAAVHRKRTPAELAALSNRVGSFIGENPGLRIEQINKQLHTKTKDLALPIRKLLAEGTIVAKGHKRSTTYHPRKGK